MTCNQLILLLHIKRGSIEDNENMGTHLSDLTKLTMKNLIDKPSKQIILTARGERFVRALEELGSLL